MRVLVTGSNGGIGTVLVEQLQAEGFELRTLDRTARPRGRTGEHIAGDLRDVATVRQAVEGMDAVVHVGALPHDMSGTPEDLYAINVLGTLHVLQACAEAGVNRVVFFSSINALGAVGEGKLASYLPIDDDYPRHPQTPYQLSKHLGEEACASYSRRYGMTTICLRPVWVMNPLQNTGMHWWRNMPPSMRQEFTKRDYWAYVDVRDVCAAAISALTVEGISHDAFLLAADDTLFDVPTAELVAAHHPDTPWQKVERDTWLADQPYRGLIDTTNVREKLGWRPKYHWRETMAE